MLSLLLIATMAVQNPPASKPTQDTTASKRTATAAPRGSQGAVNRIAFHDRMRELWTDHIVYTRSLIVSTTAGLPDTAEVLQRLMRTQDEMGEAFKPYYGDENSTKLTSLLRNHIQLAGKALGAAKGTSPTEAGMNGMNMRDSAASYRMGGDTVSSRADSTKINSQNPNVAQRMNDTTKASPDTTKAARDRQGRIQGDTTKAKQPNARVTGDTMSQRLPSNQYGNVRQDSAAQGNVYAQGQPGQISGQPAAQVDTTQLNQAVAALKASGDSIATFLAQANPRGFRRETLSSALQMHIDLLLKQVNAQVKKDWSGSIAAYDESFRQTMQMADMLSEGIMKQFPSRFTNRTTTVSTR
ncbi:MAG TPA: hypothetical protein VFM23_09805 [Gemmatimonadales bacterium]|nr:hypothetical protein [Gemmatimonadales bacterium]